MQNKIKAQIQDVYLINETRWTVLFLIIRKTAYCSIVCSAEKQKNANFAYLIIIIIGIKIFKININRSFN